MPESLSLKYRIGMFVFAFLFIQSANAYSQSTVVQEYSNPSNTITTHRNEKIHGTPFFNDDWENGRVRLKSDERTKKMKLKYKIFTNELLFKKDGRLLAVKSKTMRGFSLRHHGHKVMFTNGVSAPQYDISPQRLLQVVYDGGKIRLLKKYTVKFHRGQRPDPYSGVINSRFKRYESYFMFDADNNIHKVKLKEKDILNILSSHKNEIKAYADSKNLNFNDQQDIRRILAEYDKMLTKDKQ